MVCFEKVFPQSIFFKNNFSFKEITLMCHLLLQPEIKQNFYMNRVDISTNVQNLFPPTVELMKS